MDEDEYAIVSKKEFLALKRELDKLKKNPLEGSEHGETLQASIDNLNRSLNTMLEVFKQAADEMKLEEHDTELVSKQMGPLNDKLDTLIDQNQKIAKGIVAIADMVREKLDELASRPRLAPLGGPRPEPRPMPSGGPGPLPGPMPPPPGAMPRPSGPMPPPSGPGMGRPMPPPSPGGEPPMPDFPPLDSGDSFGGPGGKDIMGGLMK